MSPEDFALADDPNLAGQLNTWKWCAMTVKVVDDFIAGMSKGELVAAHQCAADENERRVYEHLLTLRFWSEEEARAQARKSAKVVRDNAPRRSQAVFSWAMTRLPTPTAAQIASLYDQVIRPVEERNHFGHLTRDQWERAKSLRDWR